MRTLLLFFLMTTYGIIAQEVTIKGTITDESNLPLPGVNVMIKETSKGTQTDFEGHYEITTNLGSILVFNYLGYVTEEYKITASNKEISFSMQPNTAMLEEVVVTGFAAKKERKAVGYSVSSVKTDAIKIRGLSGIAAGIDVTPATKAKIKDYGLLTAGEINDLNNWSDWIKSMSYSEAKETQKKWEFYFNHKIEVSVRDNYGKPISNAEVALYRNKKRLMIIRTDIYGNATMFKNIDDVSSKDRYLIQIFSNDKIIGREIGRSTERVSFILDNSKRTNRDVDIMFTIDATGSMGDEMDYLKAELKNIITRLDSKIEQKRIALTFYRDEGDEFLVKEYDFNSNIDLVKENLKKNFASGGGDYEEAVEEALKVSMAQSWKADTKLLFLLLDAPPHFTEENVLEIKKQINTAQKEGIKIIPIVASDANKEVEFLMRFFSISTNGTYVFLTDDSGIGNDHLEPTTSDYKVEKLNDLIVRLIEKFSGVES